MKGTEEKKAKLLAKITRLEEKKTALIAKTSIHGKKWKTISCAICDGRFVRSEIEGETCPSCGAELRSLPALQKISELEKRLHCEKSKLEELL